ncbi:enoyl-CoA hydratase/isomerase family protein [Mycobacterium malmoense]|uniref:enoyl-CoA hydratase/isomerase family protein n=1 Tax=Mycobacterium malmoense TaxID=1780 RepID=UPI0009F6165D|nr:enoyl-CoA hydratase/isomerase family protein [Mycobacterium malmoense]
MTPSLEVVQLRLEEKVLVATLEDPPLNLVGAALVRDLVALIEFLESHRDEVSVVVFDSASPNFFSAHVDMLDVPGVRAAAARLGGATLGVLFRRISTLHQVSIASVRGMVRGAGSELVLACDMRFASRERAVFGQPEVGVGAVPGAGGAQHLPRLMGRGRALEVLLSSDDYSAEVAERYGWINRALPDSTLDPFVDRLARRIARFPLAGIADAKLRVNAITLPSVSALDEDGDLFLEGAARPEFQNRIRALFAKKLQTDESTEHGLGAALAEI